MLFGFTLSLSQCFRCISVHTPPVIILCQSHFLKMNVESLAFRGLQDPVACQIVAVVARKTRRSNATIGGIFYHPPTGCYGRREGEEKRQEGDKELKVRAVKIETASTMTGGFAEKSRSMQRLYQCPVGCGCATPVSSLG